MAARVGNLNPVEQPQVSTKVRLNPRSNGHTVGRAVGERVGGGGEWFRAPKPSEQRAYSRASGRGKGRGGWSGSGLWAAGGRRECTVGTWVGARVGRGGGGSRRAQWEHVVTVSPRTNAPGFCSHPLIFESANKCQVLVQNILGRGADENPALKTGALPSTPPPVLTGHVSSLPRTDRTRLVPPPVLTGAVWSVVRSGVSACLGWMRLGAP
jgi:hypothetical protein